MPDRLDDRLVIDACDGHMDGDLVRARRNIEGLLDTIVFVQALDDIAAVVEHETVAPLAILLFQDQRAVVGLDHMGLAVCCVRLALATIIQQPDLIGRNLDKLPIRIYQILERACHGRRQGDIVVTVVFCDRHGGCGTKHDRLTASGTPSPAYLKGDLLLGIVTVRVLHPDGERFLAWSILLKALIVLADRIHHIGVFSGHGIDSQVAVCPLDGLQDAGLLLAGLTTIPGLTTEVLAVAHAVAQLGLHIRFPYIIYVLTVGLAFDRIPVLDLDRSRLKRITIGILQLQRRLVVFARDGDGDGALRGCAIGLPVDEELFLQGAAHVQFLTLQVGL